MDFSFKLPERSPDDREYTGGCHCKRFRYRFHWRPFHDGTHEISACNCSVCSMKGMAFTHMHTDAFALTAGTREELTEYRFGRRVFARFFCPTCGVEIFETKEDEDMLGVNVRTVDGVDMEKLRIKPFDGATLW
ncbi:GFA domain-containing protein [Phanerochaete sordida]|uniref:GFA domain-containing protein n=1 Tax=Phanerochaete sordida TaxID=48140 RepID=A0A9P3LDQ2_9APHY|nr:GFA domain-containing protein [Phanerochaete sordida]